MKSVDQPSSAALFEATAVALQALMLPLGIKPREIKTAGSGRTRPVVLIHGYGSNRSCMLPIEVYLRAVGHDRVFPFNFGPGGAGEGIEPLAMRLRDFVEDVFEACGGRGSVDLVAHSLGGLAARVYLQDYGGARRVDQCITISTPHLGTYSSYWAPTIVGRQMRPDSDFLARLNDPARRAPGVRFFSLWAGMDLMVLPRENSIYPEGDDACIRAAGHSGILIHPETMKLVAKRLRAGQGIASTRIERIAQVGRGIFRKGLSAITARWAKTRSRKSVTQLSDDLGKS